MKNSLNLYFKLLTNCKNISKSKLKIYYRTILTILIISFASININLFSQIASPSNWIYPEGNPHSTLRNRIPSQPQIIDSFTVKWSTPFISGDVKPLIGNIVPNERLLNFAFEPNEIVAVLGDEIVLISGTGSLIKKSKLPNYVTGIKSISALIDTNNISLNNPVVGPVILALETIEQFNPFSKDSLAYAYLFGYDNKLDSVAPLKRLAINLRDFAPNIFASVKPVYGERVNNRLLVYATVNMHMPKLSNQGAKDVPYFRGLTTFYDINNISSFPLPDIKDNVNNRVFLGPEVNYGQPSIFSRNKTTNCVLLPTFPTTENVNPDFKSVLISSLINGSYLDTYADIASLVGIDFQNTDISIPFTPFEIFPDDGTRPLIKPYYLDIIDGALGDVDQAGFILLTEQYNGLEGSSGLSKLHLFDVSGNPLTDFNLSSTINPAFRGDSNHYWSVAIGNVDGNKSNEWLPYYPNNPRNELIVTQTTRDFVYPGSKLFVLRYYTGPEIEKPTPNGDYLYQLDTICSFRINGWIAAVNDIDRAEDGKDEIFLVDGANLMIIRMRDYNDYRFRLGYPFDTVYTKQFFNQVIQSVSIADLEGDGLNDIIVTTDDSTYVLGTVIPNTLAIIKPEKNSPGIIDYCLGDTILVSWKNTIYSQDKVNLYFAYDNNGKLDTISISTNIPNNRDTVNFKFFADNSFANMIGRFIVTGTTKPQLLSDYSGIVRFNYPKILPNLQFNKENYYPNEKLIIKGNSLCSDTVFLEIKTDDKNWLLLGIDSLAKDNEFEINSILPCLSYYFACDSSYTIKNIPIRLIGKKGNNLDTLIYNSLKVVPLSFIIKIDTVKKADPTIYFYWQTNTIDSLAKNLDLSISISTDDGKIFNQILLTKLTEVKAYWNVPIDLPDSAIFRFCIPTTCFVVDTVLYGIKPNYIDIVAPNPFNPDKEQLQIVYKVPNDGSINIKIVDQANKLVAEIVKNGERMKGYVYADYWNGRRSDGATAAIGMYYVLIELSNGRKEVYPIYVRK